MAPPSTREIYCEVDSLMRLADRVEEIAGDGLTEHVYVRGNWSIADDRGDRGDEETLMAAAEALRNIVRPMARHLLQFRPGGA